jgi:hypothetical protein
MLNNNKNAMVVFMLFGFVVSKCIGDCRGQKIILHHLGFLLQPERTDIVLVKKKPVRTEK